MRLIDADRLRERLTENLDDLQMMISERGRGMAFGTSMAIDRVNEQPTIDPESLRPQGKWSGTVCSNCGESTSFYYDCNYCPNCGAKMEQEGGNETD